MMSAEKIIGDWQKNKFKPVYWLEGEEDYYIDKVMDYAEHHIMDEAAAGFNLTVFYGKDADWAAVINACRRYPMFADKQVVLLKEAQQMRDVEKLETYIENPLHSTVFVVSYKEKKLDARKKFAKLVKEKGLLISTKNMYDRELPEWQQNLVYVCTGLGIIVLDADKNEVKDTYRPSSNGGDIRVNDLVQLNELLYAATAEGLKMATAGAPNLSDYKAWQTISGNGLSPGAVQRVTAFNNGLIVQKNDSILIRQGNSWSVFFNNGMNVCVKILLYPKLNIFF